MKHTTIFLLMFLLGFTFTISAAVVEKEKNVFRFEVPEKPFSTSKSINPEKERAKRHRYMDYQKKKQEKRARIRTL